MNDKCIWCDSEMKPGTKECPVCNFKQEVGEVKLSPTRLGKCRCDTGKMLLAVASPAGGNSRDFNFCSSCISPSVAAKLAQLLVDQEVHFPNQGIADKVTTLARKGFDVRRYTLDEMVEGLVITLGVIYSRIERSLYSLTVFAE